MNIQKVNLEQIERQYLSASNLEMARLIMDKTGIYRGKCLELSVGAGYLGFALAESTMLEIYLLDNNRDTIKQAESHVERSKMNDRIKIIKGSVCEIPLADETVDLATSKKSIFTWNNRVRIFKEIYRVLAPGGVACFCGGFESDDVKFRVNTCLADLDPKIIDFLNKQMYWNHLKNFKKVLNQAGISSFKIDYKDKGMWITISKPGVENKPRGPLKFTYLGPPKAICYNEVS